MLVTVRSVVKELFEFFECGGGGEAGSSPPLAGPTDMLKPRPFDRGLSVRPAELSFKHSG